jgi:IS30 family transposase
MNKSLTDEEKVLIRKLLEDEQSHNSIAERVGRSQSTISEFAKREGYSTLPERTPRVANQARRAFAKAERLELINLQLEVGKGKLESGELSARDYKEVTTAIAIGIDKRRLEEGESNSVHETRSGHPHVKSINLEEEFRRIDEEFLEEARHDQERQDKQRHQTFEEE